MNKTTITAAAACFLMLGAAKLHSQAPKDSKSTLTVLQAIKAANQELIEKQKKTLQGLDELQLSASQLKIMGKRS